MRDERGHGGAMQTRWFTVALGGIACIAVEMAVRGLRGAVDGWAYAGGIAVLGAVVLTVGELLRRRWPGVGTAPRGRVLWVCGFVAVALTSEAALRRAFGDPLLLDALLLVALRDVVIALMVLAHHPDARPACVGFATFLVVFASASAHAVWAQGLVVAFAVIGVCWLVGNHWETLEQRLEASTRQALPRRWLFALPLAVLGVLLVVPASARQIRRADGFMPASGGRRDASDAATSGVGDGDALVAGLDDVRSFAPLEDAPFMTSHEPSLYDLFDESYNEAVKKTKTERAIPLPSQGNTRREDHSMATSRRAGREFSTVRMPGSSSRRRISDLDSRAILQVKGRVPAHLKLEVFDLYDGVEWIPETIAPEMIHARLWLRAVGGRPWVLLAPGVDMDIYGEPETHALRIIRLDSNRVPAPSRFLGVHVDQLDRLDLFRWAQPGVLRMDREKIPELQTVHVQSQPADIWRLERVRPRFTGGPGSCCQWGDDPQSRAVTALVESWVADIPRGWGQVERVVERIRAGHTLDTTARASAGCTHSVAEFLLETCRGPDYLFASATVGALRALGYSARLVSGFYADPRNYDPRADHTAVAAGDVHFWAEVHAGWGHWVTLEPTPGYELLQPRRGLAARLARAVWVACATIGRHPLVAAGIGLAVALAVWFRHPLIDRLDACLWRLWAAGAAGSASRAMTPGRTRRLRRALVFRFPVRSRQPPGAARRAPGRGDRAWPGHPQPTAAAAAAARLARAAPRARLPGSGRQLRACWRGDPSRE